MNKYRVQTRYTNPEVVAQATGKLYQWIDSSEHKTLSEAKTARKDGQRIIRICAPREGALLMDTGAYKGRRFNVIIEGDSK